MKLSLVDRISFDDQAGIRQTADGYLVANPRVARTGIQLYRGSEIGGKFKDQKVVRVYRPEEEVFNKDSMHSYAFKPLTNDHPPVQVNANNWKDYSVGQIGDNVARDGENIRVPMVFMDAQAIKDIGNGKKQLSVGYSCDIKEEAGTTPSGEAYDCSQHNIFVNHIALVKAARGGDRLTVGDDNQLPALVCDGAAIISAAALLAAGKVSKDAEGEADLFLAPGYPIGRTDALSTACLERTRDGATAAGEDHVADTAKALLAAITEQGISKEKSMPKTAMIDGVTVTFDNDQSEQIVQRHITRLQQTAADATANFEKLRKEKEEKESKDAATITTQKTQIDTLTAENTTLKAQVADATSPAKMDAAITERATVFGKAKAMLGGTANFDGKTVAEVKRMVVDHVVKDGAKGWSDEQVGISFATLTANVTADQSTAVNDARFAFNQPGFGQRTNDAEAQLDAKYTARDKALESAWMNPAGSTKQ